MYIAPFEPEIVERKENPQQPGDDFSIETRDKLIDAASKFGNDYLEHVKFTMLMNLVFVFVVLFFCCGLPILMTPFQNQR